MIRKGKIVFIIFNIIVFLSFPLSCSSAISFNDISSEDLDELFYKTVTNSNISASFNETNYLFEFDSQKHEISMHILEDVFAKGQNGEVRKVVNYFNKTAEVFKQATFEQGERAREAVKKEYDILRLVHSNGKSWGIQAPPRKLIKFTENDQSERYGYLGTLYDTDYSVELKSIKYNFESYLLDFHQLLSGLKTLQEQNILHGDLKPQNIFVKAQANGTKLIHIADFGESVKTDREMRIEKIAGCERTHTPSYSPQRDLSFSCRLKKQPDRLQLIELERKRDVFAIGSIMYLALQQTRAYKLDRDSHPITDDEYQPIDRIAIPQEMQKLVQEMLDGDYQKRPSANLALQRFENLLKEQYPEEFARIKGEIARHIIIR